MPLTIRVAETADLPAVARLAGMLVRQHHAFDAQRFLLVADVEGGYTRFLRGELSNPAARVWAAESEHGIVGYAYARLEPRDWNNLLDACVALHDIFVDESARRRGVARALLEAVRAWAASRGAPRVVLHTASKNAVARQFFGSLGFRETMIEFTSEL